MFVGSPLGDPILNSAVGIIAMESSGGKSAQRLGRAWLSMHVRIGSIVDSN